MTVIKMRGSDHSRELRAYEVTLHGLEIGDALYGYRGGITGVPEALTEVSRPRNPELSEAESRVLEAVLRMGESQVAAVSESTGLTLDVMVPSLDRLMAAGYVVAEERNGLTLYRATVQSLR